MQGGACLLYLQGALDLTARVRHRQAGRSQAKASSMITAQSSERVMVSAHPWKVNFTELNFALTSERAPHGALENPATRGDDRQPDDDASSQNERETPKIVARR